MYRFKSLAALAAAAIVFAGCAAPATTLPSAAVVQPPSVAQAQQSPTASQLAASTSTAQVPASASSPSLNIAPGADPENQIFEAVYQKVNPSVVQVSNLAANRGSSQVVPQGLGSGFVWDMQGDIVTNDHVVEGATQLQVTFSDGTTLNAQLMGTDPNSDIAVIRVDPKLATLVPVEQGDINQVKAGERVLAIGNPFGLDGTMTQGIVSALGRSIPAVATGFSIPEAIQTDAAINPGNSGGPLLNESGQVIGINDQIQSQSGSSSGVGFAIPINLVQRIVPSLIQTGHYAHPYLGIEGGTYSRAWAQALGLPANAKGAYVEGVVPGGPAAQAGLQAGNQDTSIVLGTDNFGSPVYLQSGGDLITAIDGHSITNMDDLMIYLEEHTSPGQTVQLTVLRAGGQQQTLSVKLGQRSNQAPSQIP
jgi:S1-C subfamily serine protease